jgi:hypothetical protein
MSPCLTSLPPVVTNPLLKLGADMVINARSDGVSRADGETGSVPKSRAIWSAAAARPIS